MSSLKITLNYIPINWNSYINQERTNYIIANNTKQKEKQIVSIFVKEKYKGKYPIEIKFKPHFNSKRQDLDNFRYKGILDGLVNCGVIKNDNLSCIQRIILEPVFDEKEIVDIEIKELENE